MQTERYCVQFEALAALRDPAPPASSLRWGFGGGGGGGRITEGDPDDQSKVEAQACVTRKRQQDQDPYRRKANDRAQDRTTQARYRAGDSSAAAELHRRESKKAHIIAMLRAPGGVTIEAMARAAKWQPHSVRGFLAGVVRKKLGLTLVSADGAKRARLPDYGSHGVSGGVERCGKHDRLRRRQPDCR